MKLSIASFAKIAFGLIIILLFFSLSCSHVAHRAGVESGVNASVMVGPSYNTYSPASANKDHERHTTDTQVSIGYAWKINEKKRIMVQWMANSWDSRISERNSWLSTGLDIYYQHKSEPTNAGVGLVVGYDPKLYLMWGRDYGNPQSKFGTGLDFGLGFGIDVSIIPQLMYTVKYDYLQTSLLVEYRLFVNSFSICDENCDNEYLRSRLIMALVFTIDSPKNK